MTILLNDDEIDLSDGATIAELFSQLGVEPRGFVVVVNSEIVPRSEFDSFVLEDSSTVEMMVLFAGG